MFKDKTIIVTGSVQGIGLGIAKDFLQKGARVVVSDLSQEKCDEVVSDLARDYDKSNLLAKAADVSDRKAVEGLILETVKHFGKLDVFVNNAGIYPFKSLLDMTDKDWNLVQDVNLKGSFYCIQESAKVMEDGGRIIIISSIASIIGFAGLSHYCASKSAVNGLVRASALELASKGITVNTVAPGAIKTPGTGSMDDKSSDQLINSLPIKRWGQPEDIAHAVSFLAAEQASYVTGQVVVVDGGWTIQ